MADPLPHQPRTATPWPLLLAIAAVGCALRIAAARGGLWLDEAWSAVFARDVGTPAGVFLNIHHDNNHHFNTLWLQLVGFDSPPLLQRALAIAAGTLAVVVAGAIGARRGRTAAIVTASLVAVSPMLVTYGSEARGYAPMVLALLIAILIAERWLDRPDRPPPAVALAVTAVAGTLAQLTMAFGVVAIAGWTLARLLGERRPAAAFAGTLRLMALPLAATAATIAAILRLLPGAAGFQFGNFQPFTGAGAFAGVDDLLVYSFGLAASPILPPLAFVATLLAVLLVRPLGLRAPFYLLAIIGLPLGIALLRIGNAGIPRYYLLSCVALLLLAGEGAALAIAHAGRARIAAIVALAVVATGSTWRDAALMTDLRADPARVIGTMRGVHPRGSTIALDRPRAVAVVTAAAAAARYPLAMAPCGQWLFIDRDGSEPFPPVPRRCGRTYRAVARGDPTGLSGTHWRLYARE